MTAKYQRQRKFRAIPHKLTMHFVLEAVFVGFRKQWGTLQVDDITLWQAPVSWSFSPDKYFNGILQVILKRGQGKEVKFGDTHPCFARVGQGGHCSKLFNSLALTFTCKISVPMIYHQIWFLFFCFSQPIAVIWWFLQHIWWYICKTNKQRKPIHDICYICWSNRNSLPLWLVCTSDVETGSYAWRFISGVHRWWPTLSLTVKNWGKNKLG